jgi:hypothetical protein
MIVNRKKFRDVKPGDSFAEIGVTVPNALEDKIGSMALEVVSDNAKDVYGDRLWIVNVIVTVKASIGVITTETCAITSEEEYALAGGEKE